MSDTTGRELLAKYGPTFGDVIGNLERELSAANARIAELEDAIINANDGLLGGEGVPLTYYMRNGKYKDLIASVTAPSQPTTLPE